MSNIVSIRDLKKFYDNGETKALNGINLDIEKGEFEILKKIFDDFSIIATPFETSFEGFCKLRYYIDGYVPFNNKVVFSNFKLNSEDLDKLLMEFDSEFTRVKNEVFFEKFKKCDKLALHSYTVNVEDSIENLCKFIDALESIKEEIDTIFTFLKKNFYYFETEGIENVNKIEDKIRNLPLIDKLMFINDDVEYKNLISKLKSIVDGNKCFIDEYADLCKDLIDIRSYFCSVSVGDYYGYFKGTQFAKFNNALKDGLKKIYPKRELYEGKYNPNRSYPVILIILLAKFRYNYRKRLLKYIRKDLVKLKEFYGKIIDKNSIEDVYKYVFDLDSYDDDYINKNLNLLKKNIKGLFALRTDYELKIGENEAKKKYKKYANILNYT